MFTYTFLSRQNMRTRASDGKKTHENYSNTNFRIKLTREIKIEGQIITCVQLSEWPADKTVYLTALQLWASSPEELTPAWAAARLCVTQRESRESKQQNYMWGPARWCSCLAYFNIRVPQSRLYFVNTLSRLCKGDSRVNSVTGSASQGFRPLPHE